MQCDLFSGGSLSKLSIVTSEERPAPTAAYPFRVVSDFAPAGDQPSAVERLSQGVEEGQRFQTLLGITGSGKSATIAWTIEKVQRPTLVLAPNKSLAAQLANEFREFFPDNRVEYFVSYYDYYQPEAYMPASDTYIETQRSKGYLLGLSHCRHGFKSWTDLFTFLPNSKFFFS